MSLQLHPFAQQQHRANGGKHHGTPRLTLKDQVEKLRDGNVTAYPLWYEIFKIFVDKSFAMSPAALYEFVRHCPRKMEGTERNLPLELVQRYRDHTLEHCTVEHIEKATPNLMTLIQLSSFYGAEEYLKQFATIVMIYRALGREVPPVIGERMAMCARKQNELGAFTQSAVVAAGYNEYGFDHGMLQCIHPETRDQFEFKRPIGATLANLLTQSGYEMKTTMGTQDIWIHPVTKKTVNVHHQAAKETKVAADGKKLGGVALMSQADIAAAQKAKKERIAAGKAARRAAAAAKKNQGPKVKVKKEGEDKKKKK